MYNTFLMCKILHTESTDMSLEHNTMCYADDNGGNDKCVTGLERNGGMWCDFAVGNATSKTKK